MRLACLVLLTACGRIGFDDPSEGAGMLDAERADRYAAVVLDDGPLAYFRFDDTAGPTLTRAVGTATARSRVTSRAASSVPSAIRPSGSTA